MSRINTACLIVFLLINGCDNSENSATSRLYSTVIFRVHDANQNLQLLTYSYGTIYCTVATWCPFSKKLVQLLKDPKYKSVMRNYKFVFLIHHTEYSDMIDQLEADKNLTSDEKREYKSRLDELFKYQDVFDPNMLTDLPGEYYFIKTVDFNKKWDGYPCAYNTQRDVFNADPIKLMQMMYPSSNTDLLDEMYDKYSHAESAGADK